MAGRYDWTSGAPPRLDEHSAAKHRVLRRYVENYIQILCQDPHRDRMRLIVVDGFCGGGVYQDEAGVLQPGSPLILREALQCGRARLHTRRTEMGMRRPFDFEARLYLNDIDPNAIAMLREQLRTEPDTGWAPNTQIRNLPFDQLARQLIAEYQGRRGSPRILFVLDQYGLSDATLPVMRELFAAFPKAEIVLTFAIDTLVNFASENMLERYEKMLAKMGFDEVVSAQRLTKLKAEDDGAKHLIQTVILREVFPQTGAAFATPFFIIPKQSRRGYWLVHLANSLRANDEMKSLHWQERNHFMHFGAEGLNILAFDPLRLESSQTTFDFGDYARERTLSALNEDLLRRIHDSHAQGITVASLLQSVANETPATGAMIRQTLFELDRDRQLDVRSGTGRSRKSVERLQADDEVHPRRQFILL